MMDTSKAVAEEAKDTVQQMNSLNVGKTLREAREAQGMSVHDIADRVKFAPRQVEALESNDFANLPTATFLRGFVRSYARVLQLDEAALVAALPKEPSQQLAAKDRTVKVAFPGQMARQRLNLIWLAGALGVALVLGLFIWIGGSESVQKPAEVVMEPVPLPVPDTGASAVAASGVVAEIATAPKAAEPVMDEKAKVAEKANVPEKVAVPEKTNAPVKANVPEKAVAPEKAKTPEKLGTPEKIKTPEIIKTPEKTKSPEEATGKQKPVAPSSAATATPTESKPEISQEQLKRRPLHFVFSGAAWIEVVDVNGDLLLSRTNLGGTEKWIGGPRRAPYNISIGHPDNVKLYYKGKEIDLSAYAGMDSARIKVE